MKKSKIAWLACGGTLEKDYNELTGELVFPSNVLPKLIEESRLTIDIDIHRVMMKDSLEMTDDDRQILLKSVSEVDSNRILITHGTDTMVDSALVLQQAQLAKTIVLTGAMRPFALAKSDASFNLGCALAFSQTLESGVYIAMNGQYFPADEVIKNRELGVFQRR